MAENDWGDASFLGMTGAEGKMDTPLQPRGQTHPLSPSHERTHRGEKENDHAGLNPASMSKGKCVKAGVKAGIQAQPKHYRRDSCIKKMHYSPFEAHDSPLTPCLLPTVFCEYAGEWVICNLNRGNGVSV